MQIKISCSCNSTIVSTDGQSVIFKIGSNVIKCGETSYETEKDATLVYDTTYISYNAVALLETMRK